MATVFCPNCSDLVAREGHHCTRCGIDLFATYSDGQQDVPTYTGGRLEFPTGSTFARRYTIIERIGAGGMGVVYKAIDTMLDGEVALKVIQPALAEMPGFIERFRREVRVTRQITHPNICRFHDIGEDEGVLYVSMEWIEGETLRALMEQTGILRDARALEIAEKIALALEAAHDKGIIHRDLKPANIMLDRRGNVFVLDFGLALERDGEEITDAGVLMGTPGYMSPEQRRLDRLDHRTDLYALGLILREMLIGTRLDPVPGLTEPIRAAVNPLVVPVLERLLEEDPSARCPSAAEARQAIRDLLDNTAISTVITTQPKRPPERAPRRALWIGAAGVVLAAVLGVSLWIAFRPAPSAMDPQARVLYDKGVHYLQSEGETDRGLGDAIEKFNQAREYEPDSALIWAKLGEAHWMRYRQNRLPVHRQEAERAVARAYELDPGNPLVLTARAVGFIEQGQFGAAKQDLEKALEKAPDREGTWCTLGSVHQALGDYAAGIEAFREAERLSPNSYSVQVYLGRFHESFGEYDEARKYYRRGTELKPDSPIAWNNLGAANLHIGNITESVPLFERSLEIEDRSSTRSNLGTAYYFLGRYEDAAENYRRAIELEPDDAVYHGNLGDALVKLGRPQDARDAYREAAERARDRSVREPLNPAVRGELGLYCAKAGDAECATEAGSAAAELRPNDAEIALDNAVIRCVVGRDDDCLEWLERAIKLGVSRSQIEATPELERLEGHPRFRDLLDLAS